MAAKSACNLSSLMPAEQFRCSICLDEFEDPVSTPCGHNFCRNCLTQYWDMIPHCKCPLCKEKFQTRPKLKVNTTLRDVVEHYKRKSQAAKHKSHNVTPVEERGQENQTGLQRTKSKKQLMIQDRLKKIQEIRDSAELSKKSTEREVSESIDVFSDLIGSVEKSQAELLEVMLEKQKAVENQSERLIKDLQREIDELKRVGPDLEQVLNTVEQIYPSVRRRPTTQNRTDIGANDDLSGETLVSALIQIQKAVEQKLSAAQNKMLRAGRKPSASMELKSVQQYAVDVVLDPDTAHPNLVLSCNGKQVACGNFLIPQKQPWNPNTPDTSKRFTCHAIILGKQSFSLGKFYFEVQVSGKTDWDLGVVRESVNRKGKINLKPQEGFWSVVLRKGDTYKAGEETPVLLSLKEKPQKVGVFVDYEEGLVSFYDVENRVHIYSYTGQTFIERLYPYFCPCLNDGGRNAAPLIITPVIRHEF